MKCCLLQIFHGTLVVTIIEELSVSKSLDPDQDRRYVGPDLGPNYFQR